MISADLVPRPGRQVTETLIGMPALPFALAGRVWLMWWRGFNVSVAVVVEAIKRLLAEKPAGLVLAVPGMPAGSPGMEVEGMAPDTYDVVLFGPAMRSIFAQYRGAEPT